MFVFLHAEYETGTSGAGKNLGFQTSGALNPFPIITGESSPEQKVLDFQYSSVDENQDGIPDDQAGKPRRVPPVNAPAAEQPIFAQPQEFSRFARRS